MSIIPLTRHRLAAWTSLVAALALWGCASPIATSTPVPTALIRPSAGPLSLDQGLNLVTHDLVQRARQSPGFANAARPLTVVDRVIDAGWGQETLGSRHLDRQLSNRLAELLPTHRVVALEPDPQRDARWLVSASLGPGSGTTPGQRLDATLIDLDRGLVLAHAWQAVVPTVVDATPTRLFRANPGLATARAAQAQIRSARAEAGEPADTTYLAALDVNGLIGQADAYVERGRCTDTLGQLQPASDPAESLRSRLLQAVYRCQVQEGQWQAAEASFGRIVALGIAQQKLSIKLLFQPASSGYVADPRLSAPYPIWIRRIAAGAQQAEACLDVTGHSGKSQSERRDPRLSLQRAEAVRAQLLAAEPGLVARLRVIGAGARENLVGTGTDDLRDALDRRVELRLRPC